jgi:hypothetical protein
MKTSDVYRTKNIPERFDNPSKFFYRFSTFKFELQKRDVIKY